MIDREWTGTGHRLDSESRTALAEELARAARDFWALGSKVDFEQWSSLLKIRLNHVGMAADGRYMRHPLPTIQLRADRPEPRQRFTFAHEVGHHVLEECRRNPDLRRQLSRSLLWALADLGPGSAQEEEMCDEFAIELLLPREAAVSWVKSAHGNASDFLQLTRSHGISLTAAHRRLSQMGRIGSLLVVERAERSLVVRHAIGCNIDVGSVLDRHLVSEPGTDCWYAWVQPDGSRVRTRGTLAGLDNRSTFLFLAHVWGRDHQRRPAL